MPIYEYGCKECRNIIEVLMIRTDDEGPEKCEHCDGEMVKLMSSGGFVIDMDARETLFNKTLPSIQKDKADIMAGNESKLENILGDKKAAQVVKERIRSEKTEALVKKSL